jgi:hypothetical protein
MRLHWHERQQQWLQAAAAAAAADDLDTKARTADLSTAEPAAAAAQQRRLLAKEIDGVKTHMDWLRKQRMGLANNDTRALPGR